LFDEFCDKDYVTGNVVIMILGTEVLNSKGAYVTIKEYLPISDTTLMVFML
jgi:hypothetical protein